MASDGSTMTSVLDPIHGHITLDPLLVAIVDTPQFQRLRNIKQLGNVHYVYPGATHSRFQHSLGVAHLAGEFLKMIKRNTGEEWEELKVTRRDELCVEIAGLCHDLGHGPFSHLFEKVVVPRIMIRESKWKHEKASWEMFQYLLDQNPSIQDGCLTDDDVKFIKELINPEDLPGSDRSKDPKKKFLYEIVANANSGIDVDKWDYFERDATSTGLPRDFDTWRAIRQARVITFKDGAHICMRDKEAYNLYQMFHTRYSLYKRVYYHPVCTSAELMVADALVNANEHLKFHLLNGSEFKMSDAVDNMEMYSMLNDQVLQQIKVSTDDGLKKSRDILQRLETRKFYKVIAVAVPATGRSCQEPKMTEIFAADQARDPSLKEEDFVLYLAKYNYGSKDKNPLEKVWFYSKEDPKKVFKMPPEQVSAMLPNVFEEQELRLYCKVHVPKDHSDYQDAADAARRCFKTWCDANEMKLREKPIATGEVAADVEAYP